MTNEVNNFDEERIDTIGTNGNEGLHYPKPKSSFALKDLGTEEIKDLLAIMLTILTGNKEIVTDVTLDDDYLANFPALQAISRKENGENPTA